MIGRDREVLGILIEAGRPMTLREIIHAGNALGENAVMNVLRRYIKTGDIDDSGVIFDGKAYIRIYRPTQKCREMILQSLVDKYKKMEGACSKSALIEMLINGNMDSEETLKDVNELKQLTEELSRTGYSR